MGDPLEPPKQVKPTKSADYLEVLTKAAFQSGMSWAVVEAKWAGFQEAFSGFEPETVATLTPDDLDRLTADTRIIRNRRKIESTVHNAQVVMELESEFGSFKNYLKSIDGFLERVADLRKRFKHIGDFGAYYFLYVIGEPVPEREEAQAMLERGLPKRPKAV